MPDMWIAAGLIIIAILVVVVRPAAQIARLEGHLQSIDNNFLEFHARVLRLEERHHSLGDRISQVEVYLPIPPERGQLLKELARKKGVPAEFLAMYAMDKTLGAASPPNPQDPFPELTGEASE